MRQNFILNTVIKFGLLFGLWLLLSGHYDLIHTSMGIFSSALIIALNYRLRKYYYFKGSLDETGALIKDVYPTPIRKARLVFYYIPWLLWQIVVSSLQVAYVVLHPKLPIDPSILCFRTKLPTKESRVILANSITLTPGTITVRLKDDEFLVHSLMDASQSGIVDGSLPGEVAKLYEKKPGQVVQHLESIHTREEFRKKAAC